MCIFPTTYEVSIFNRSQDIKGPQNFTMGHVEVNFWPEKEELDIVNSCTKYEVRNVIRSELIVRYQILKLGYVTLTSPTLGLICHAIASTCCVMYVPNSKFLSLTIPKI